MGSATFRCLNVRW